MNIQPFKIEYFFKMDNPRDFEILKNFEKIVQEKYSDRIFSLLKISHNNIMVNKYKATAVKSADEIVTRSVEIMINTNDKLYMHKYENVFGTDAFFHFVGDYVD